MFAAIKVGYKVRLLVDDNVPVLIENRCYSCRLETIWKDTLT